MCACVLGAHKQHVRCIRLIIDRGHSLASVIRVETHKPRIVGLRPKAGKVANKANQAANGKANLETQYFCGDNEIVDSPRWEMEKRIL